MAEANYKMKEIDVYFPEKYQDLKYEKVFNNIYRIYDDFLEKNCYVTSLRFIQEPEFGEGMCPNEISQYPLEDILDQYFVWISDFYAQENSESDTYCYLEFMGADIDNIKSLLNLVGKHYVSEENICSGKHRKSIKHMIEQEDLQMQNVNEKLKQLHPICCNDYASMGKENQRQYADLICGMMDLNADMQIYADMILTSVNKEQVGYFIKEKCSSCWMNLEQLADVYSEWKDVFKETFSEFKKMVMNYTSLGNIIMIYLNCDNMWIYVFEDLALKKIDSEFTEKYLGTIMSAKDTRKLIEEEYMPEE